MKTLALLHAILLAFCTSIIARSTSHVSDVSSFNCGIPRNLNAVNLSGTSVVLHWDAVSGAGSYRVEVENFRTGVDFFRLDSVVTGASLQVDNLELGVLYKFTVSAYCDAYGPPADFFLFRTPADSNLACTPPLLLSSRINGASGVITWNKTGDTQPYQLEIQMHPAAPEVFKIEAQTTDTFYPLADLQPGALYKFRVNKACGSEQGTWSEWQYFNGSTADFGAVAGEGPDCMKPFGLQVTGIQASSVNLTWYPAPTAKAYGIEVEYYDANAVPWQFTSVVVGTSFRLTGLAPGTRYKFKVRTYCTGGGQSIWSNWRKFQTADMFAPQANEQHAAGRGAEQRSSDAESTPVALGAIAVWPNPVASSATIRLNGLQPGALTLRVLDLAGRPVLERQFEQEAESWEGPLSFEDMPTGCYILQVNNGGRLKNTPVTVMR